MEVSLDPPLDDECRGQFLQVAGQMFCGGDDDTMSESKIRGNARLEDFSEYFEFKKDEIQLINLKLEKPRKSCPDIGSDCQKLGALKG